MVEITTGEKRLFLRQVSSVRRSAVFKMLAATQPNYRQQAIALTENWPTLSGFEGFYEKVIKVKADVAALLNLFSDVSIDVRW